MLYRTTCPIVIGGYEVAEIELELTIETTGEGASISGRFKDWTVGEVRAEGSRFAKGADGQKTVEHRQVSISDDHWLYARILADVLTRERRNIDDAWERDQEANTRRPRLALVS